RERLAREFKAKSPWEIKQSRGGIVDLDFVIQSLILKHASEQPGVIRCNSLTALDALAEAGALEKAEAESLKQASLLLQTLQSLLRLTLEDRFEEETAPDGVKKALAAGCGALDFDELKAKLKASNEAVLSAFQRTIEEPAQALPAPADEK
ncbi:MAG: hypothetical protein P8X52_12500, partial [Limibacillus sp.]